MQASTGRVCEVGTGSTDTGATVFWPPLMVGMTEGNRAAENETVGCHHPISMDVNLSTPGIVKQREAWCATAHGVAELDTRATEQRIGNLISEDLFYWARARIWNPELELPTSYEQMAQKDKFWRLS